MKEINRERMLEDFLAMVQIDSESLNEKNMGDYVKKFLEPFADEIHEDSAKEAIGSNQSNIIAKIYGNTRKKTLLFACHLDTVKPGIGVKPFVDNGVVRSDGTTILGADDKAGIASLFEAIRYIKENDIDIPNIELVFTVAEEIGLKGAKNLDFSLIKAKEGYALDSEDIEGVFVRAPSQNFVGIEIEGVESHAGMSPEKGISAIKTAADAIMRMPLGRIDSHTTANLGIIQGGIATNIVPKNVSIRGEVRSHSEEKLEYYTQKIKSAVFDACSANRIQMADGMVRTALCSIDVQRAYNSMNVKPGESVLNRAVDVYKKIGIQCKLMTGGGGSDANIFNEHGIKTVILGTGMSEVHSVNEYIKIDDMETTAKIIIELISHDE